MPAKRLPWGLQVIQRGMERGIPVGQRLMLVVL
jgi:hypothetical protein